VSVKVSRLQPSRWDLVRRLAREYAATSQLPAVSLHAATSHEAAPPIYAGMRQPGGTTAVDSQTIYPIASITKPIVGLAFVMLIERGLVSLSTKVAQVLPELATHGKGGLELRHLLTHTSGLPDLLDDNQTLRESNAPLQTFVEKTCEATTAFLPGRGAMYQSMGFALAGTMFEAIAGKPLGLFLQEELFRPLGMESTCLGMQNDWQSGPNPREQRIAEVSLSGTQQQLKDGHWNSTYWRKLGAPWGGMLSSGPDMARFARWMLTASRSALHFCSEWKATDASVPKLVSPAGIRLATANHLAYFKELPEADRRARRWGIGWRHHWGDTSAYVGDLWSEKSFGHWGASGSLLWIDPEQDLSLVILSTQAQPIAGESLARLANLVCAAFDR
jgi:CubicO group peptidase (beta-lactamase class C family)